MTETQEPFIGENDPPAPGLVERIAAAIGDAEIGYSINLTRLVRGVSTYTLAYEDGETLKFPSLDAATAHLRTRRHAARATAALRAIEAAGYVVVPREPTKEMVAAGYEMTPDETMSDDSDAINVWEAMIAAAPKVG